MYLLHRFDDVGGLGVHGHLGAEALGQLEFGVVDVDGHHAQAHRAGVLHGDVSKAADAGDRHPLPRPRVRHLQALVDRDARARDGRDLQRVGVVRDARRIGGVDEHVAAEAAVDGVAAVLLALAQCLPAGAAVLARAARRPQPRVADFVADLEILDAFAERDDGAVALVAGDERRLRLDRPITVCGMQIGVADAGGLQFDQRLAVARRWQVEFFDLQWCAEFGDDGRAHGVGGVGGAGCASHLWSFFIPFVKGVDR